MRPALRAWLEGAAGLVFPPACAHCGGLVEDSGYAHLCAPCASRIEWVPSSLEEEAGEAAFGRVRAGTWLRGPVRSLLLEFKYRRGLHLLGDLRELLGRVSWIHEYLAGSVLVPVPLHPRKRRERGFNQSEALAGILSGLAGLGRPERLLRRLLDTPSQALLDRAGRRENMKNAFALGTGAVLNPGQRYVLVDDVFTSGATLHGCALALRRAGGLIPDVIALARAEMER